MDVPRHAIADRCKYTNTGHTMYRELGRHIHLHLIKKSIVQVFRPCAISKDTTTNLLVPIATSRKRWPDKLCINFCGTSQLISPLWYHSLNFYQLLKTNSRIPLIVIDRHSHVRLLSWHIFHDPFLLITQRTKLARLTNLIIFNLLQQYVSIFVYDTNSRHTGDLDALRCLIQYF